MKDATKQAASQAVAHLLAIAAMLMIAGLIFFVR